MNGAKSLLNKSKEKFQLFQGVHRKVIMRTLLREMEVVRVAYDECEKTIDFDWDLVPNLEEA